MMKSYAEQGSVPRRAPVYGMVIRLANHYTIASNTVKEGVVSEQPNFGSFPSDRSSPLEMSLI